MASETFDVDGAHIVNSQTALRDYRPKGLFLNYEDSIAHSEINPFLQEAVVVAGVPGAAIYNALLSRN